MSNGFSLAATAEPKVATPGLNKTALLFVLMAVAGVGAGLYAFYAGHHNVYNNTREMPWGILISSYAFFAITSTGLCLLAAISHIFGGNRLAPLANRMVWLSIITIIGGFTLIGLELESPWRMAIYNVTSPNLTSNIWWMGTLYGLAVGFMFVEFFLILTKQYKLAITLGVLGALAEVAANTNLGAVFATLSGRPYWYGAQLPVYFLACSFMSGAAAAVLFTNFAYKMRNEEMNEATYKGVQSAAKVLFLMLFLVSVATAWRTITFYVGGSESGRVAANALMNGPLATNFWIFEISIGLIFPLAILAMTKMRSLPAMSAAALMTLVGQFFSRYDLVVAGQLVPQYEGWDKLPSYFSYVPSVSELLVTLAGIGFVGAAFILGERFFGRAFEFHGEH
ncbi:MAG: polysulfide reductase NrfD [Deltaproteobacteria bacterium]|nr:polysulfide reductase NrfD [Deltaproteobacteria bacterium]